MKKRVVNLLILIIILIFPTFVYAIDFDLKSENVVLYNFNDNEILYEKNKDEKAYIASMTKLLTALTVVENKNNLNEQVVIKNDDFKNINEMNLATAGFKVNDKVTYNDLLYGLLFSSGAECANALANNTFKSQEEFVNKMNVLAKKIGMKNTHMNNPIGFDEENHYASVEDVYILFKASLQNKILNKILTATEYTTSNNLILKNKVINRYNSNKNNLGKMIAGKTGTTKKAGYALVSMVSKNDINLVLVTTTSPLDSKAYYNYQDAATIYNYYLKNYKYQNIVSKNQTIVKINTKYAKERKAEIITNDNIKKFIPNDSKITYKYKGIDIIKPSIKSMKKVGKIEVYVNDKKVKTVDAYLKEKVQFSLKEFIKANKLLCLIIFLIIIILIKKNCKVSKKIRKKHLKRR